MRLRSAALVAASVLGPAAAGTALVLALVPLDPPDLGWGHTASHAIPAAVVAAVALLGRRAWPPPASPRLRRLLVLALWALAAGQGAEAVAAALGHHDGPVHAAFLPVAALAAPLVVLAAALSAAAWVLRVSRAGAAGRRARRPAAAPPPVPAAR